MSGTQRISGEAEVFKADGRNFVDLVLNMIDEHDPILSRQEIEDIEQVRYNSAIAHAICRCGRQKA